MDRFRWERLGRDAVCTHDHRKLSRTRGPTVARTFALLALLTALGACTNVGPAFVKPEVAVVPAWTVEEQAQFDAAKAANAAWWRAFNDPTLDKLVDQAWGQNLTVRAAGLRIAQARAQLALAVGLKWPQTQEAFGQATAEQISGTTPNIERSDRNFSEFQAGFDASWELDFWGRYRNIQRAEAANYLTTIADYNGALVTLSADVARTYALIRMYETQLAITEKNVRLQAEGYRIAEVRFRQGATSELDPNQARTQLETTRVAIPGYQIRLRQAQNALSTLLGQPPGTVQELLDAGRGIPVAPATAAVGMPAELLRRRPDIRSAEFAALAQSAVVGVATADLYPSISLSGSIGLLLSRGARGASSGFNDSGFYSFGPNFRVPILDYDRTRNRIRIEDARLQELLVSYEDVVLRAQQEAEDGLVGFVKAHEQAAFAQNATTAAQSSVDIAFVQYREGAVDFQRVIDAMRLLLQDEITLAQAQSDIATNLISLYKALGGGWELHKDQPYIPEKARTEMEERTNWGDLLSSPPPPETLNTQSR